MSREAARLAQELANEDVAARRTAVEKLNTLGEDASAAAVALVNVLSDQDETVRQLANSALENCGPPPQDAVDELEPLLTSENADIAYWAATLLGRLQAGAVQAVESLKAAAADHPADEVRKRPRGHWEK